MTFEEALQAIKEGKKVRNKGWSSSVYLKKYFDRVVNQDGKTMNLTITSMLSDDWEEYKEPVLDEKEKEYLSAVIKPFRDRVIYIKKIDVYLGCNKYDEYILGELGNKDDVVDTFALPYFPKGTMYNGMETNKKYTLEELGL